MAKTVRKKVIQKQVQAKQREPLIPEKYQDVAYVLLMFALIYIFFWEAITGGGFNVSDNIASNSFIPYLDEAKKTGEFPHWVPYIFCGMPSYASLLLTGDRTWDFAAQIFFGSTRIIGSIFNSDVARVLCFYCVYGLGMYILMRAKKHSQFVAFVTGFAAVFSTYVITWVMIGHNTKPIVLAMFPFIFLFLEKLREKWSLLYAVLLVFALHIMMEGGHIQMMFYGAVAVIIYFIFELISRTLTKTEPIKVLRAGVLLVLATGIAFLMSSDRYLTTLEYTEYSTRGMPPITASLESNNDRPQHDYSYATMWSYSPEETFSFVVPGFYGANKVDFQGQKVHAYWGQKESEDSPPYMGIGFLGLALIGFILYRKDAFVQALFSISVFSILLSFGRNSLNMADALTFLIVFPLAGLIIYFFVKGKVPKPAFYIFLPIFIFYLAGIFGIHKIEMFHFYDLFFYNLPLFHTFRAPSMALALLHFAIPILAGYGLTGIIKMRKELTKKEQYLIYSSVAVSFFLIVLGFIYSALFKEMYIKDAVASLAAKYRVESIPMEFGQAIWSSMISDWYISAFIAVILSLTAFFFVKNKLPRSVFFIALIAIFIFDMFRINYRPMEVSDKKLQDEVFTPYAGFYSQLQKDESLFRVADFFIPQENMLAYFGLQSVGGYHPAKLRIYQDLMDVANSEGYEGSTHKVVNPFLWNIMNVKYIIDVDRSNQQSNAPQIYPNPDVLPRAFYVASAKKEEPLEILYRLKKGDFEPLELAFIEKELPVAISSPDSLDNVEITEWKNEYIKISATSSANNLLFLSEIYYPPAWKAYINGHETEIFKTNYAFRSIIVPKGEHTIEFKYESSRFETGKTMSLVLNILTFGALAFCLVMIFKRKFSKKLPTESNLNQNNDN